MKITTNHPDSSYGLPVILDDAGDRMTRSDGVKAVKAKLGYTNEDLAKVCGVSPRTVDGWLTGRHVNAAALNVMGDMIKYQVVNRLERYQVWRRGADTEQPNPTQLGLDIDAAIEALKQIQ